MRLFLLLLLAIPILAQNQRFFPSWDASITQDLKLTDAQARDIRSTVREYRARLIDLRAQLEKAEVEVEEVFNEDTFDPRRANEAIDRAVNARAELARVFSQMNTRLRAILTADQWRELQRRGKAKSSSAARPSGD